MAIQQMLVGTHMGVTFTPVTHTYTTAGSANETIPTNASSVTIEAWGPGGGGNWATSNANRCGGGGGGYCVKVFSVAAGDWGSIVSYIVGAAGLGRTGSAGNGVIGSASTTTGTLNSVSANLTANSGGGGVAGGSGAAGTATGGTTNTSGTATSSFTGGAGASGGGLSAGAGGTGINGGAGGNGGVGRVRFAWT